MALINPVFRPLPLGVVRPAGWLLKQLQTQASGLSGNLDLVWPDVRSSQWFGGKAESWERAPYWLDGAIPLAFHLPDSPLRARVKEKVDYVVDHQHADGWLGPREMVASGGAAVTPQYDLWAQFLAQKALLQYHEVTGDNRVAAALEANLKCLHRYLDRKSLHDWGQFRWFEALLPVQWLYERTGETWLQELATTLAAQGFDYGRFFERWPFRTPAAKGRWTFASHVVNNAMAVKAHGLWWRHTGDIRDRAAVYDMIGRLDRHHGMVTGMFTGDECLAGLSPIRGTELCAVVEYAFSLEILAGLYGDVALADRLERVAYNAIPATFSPDMWTHQYDQQVNQIECSAREDRCWGTNGPESNCFGLEPNYGCCTANLSQGWPKLVTHAWMATMDGGLAAVVWAPTEMDTTIAGSRVHVSTVTEYPFRDEITVRVAVDTPVTFPLELRIPGWCTDAVVTMAGQPAGGTPRAGTYHRVERRWSGETEVRIRLPARARLERRSAGMAAITRGPLVLSHPVGEEWRRIRAEQPGHELPHGDWEIHPTTPWAWALELEGEDVESSLSVEHRPVGDLPFSPAGAPLVARVAAREVPGWVSEHGSAGEIPSTGAVRAGPSRIIELIPYGSTNLRMTELPLSRA